MKKLFALCSLVAMTMSMLAASFPANDSRIVYIGRTQVVDNTVRFDWTATYVRVAFTGKELKLHLSDDVCRNFFNVIVDGPIAAEPTMVIPTAKDTVITLASFKKKGNHTVILQKRTEGEQGTVVFREFITDGTLTQAEPMKARQIEFVGDSYTCGYGSENSIKTDPFMAETESSAKTYAAIVARYFDADYVAVAHSGMGIARNYNSKFADWYMGERYEQIFDKDSTQANRWDASKYDFHPAMTVIYLGANDFSCRVQPHYNEFVDHYMVLIKNIRKNYGEDHPILCCTAKNHEYLGKYVHRMVMECGLKNVNYLTYCPAMHNEDGDLGASFHPSYVGHQKIAHVIIPHIATITGWGLQDRPIK